MDKPQRLFTQNDLRLALEASARKLRDELLGWNPDELLALPEADVVEHLVEAHSVICPRLRRDEAHLLPVSEHTQTFQDAWGDRVTRQVTQLTLVVPFDGEQIVFSMRASQSYMSPPQGTVVDGELQVTWVGQGAGGADAAGVRANLDAELDKIEQALSWCQNDIDAHNQMIRATTPGLVAERRAKLLRDRELEAALGFPVQRRSDAASYAVPMRRRRIAPAASPRPRPTIRGPFQPEPMLAEVDYEAALGVLRNSRNALERSPSMTTRLNEEQIRDLLLVNLNAQFEGKAGGEVFNGEGKTDILTGKSQP